MSSRKANLNDANSEIAPAPLSSLASLPSRWEWSRLGDICRTTSGGTPSRKHASYFAGNIPWVKSGELPDGVVTDVEECITEEAVKNSSAKLFPAGTLLIALYGATVGKLGILKHAATTNQAVCAIFPPDHLDTKYLFWYLRCARSDLVAQAVGGAQPNISQGILRTLPIPVAPLDQQKHIVAEIEKQFSRLDEAVANLKRVKANLKRYKAAVLKAAVEGRLVETEAELASRAAQGGANVAGGRMPGATEGRNYETGAQLLQRLLETRRSQWKGKGKYKEPTAPDTTDLPELPEGWVWASVDQLIAYLTDGDHQPPPQTHEGIPFLVIGNVRNGEIDFTDTRYVGEAYYESLDPYRKPKLGDLLYTLVGSYGIPVRVKTDAPFCIQRHMAILRPHENSPMEYLTLAMASDNVFKQATAVATGTAQKTVPLAGLRRIAIPLPPPAEQLRIVSELKRRLSILSGSETETDVNLKRADRLRRSILDKAFSGQLIPEDSSAEPASALLARIRIDEEPKQTTKTPKASKAKPTSKEVRVADLIDVLKSAGDWISAQDAFRRCGAGDGTDTDEIERLYAELRDYVRPGIIEVERRDEEDWLRVSPSKGA